jgi:hypothetical protein
MKKGTGIDRPGISHQNRVRSWLESRYGAKNVANQVRIIPTDPSLRFNESWVIVDHVTRDPVTGEIRYWDSKAGRLGNIRQDILYPRLQKFGGEVRTAIGLPDWLQQGQQVPPGTVTKVPPQAVEIAGFKDDIRGTSNRATSHESRATGDDGIGRRRPASAGERPGPANAPAYSSDAPTPRMRGHSGVPDVRVKLSTSVFRFVRGLALQFVVGIVVGSFVSWAERRISKDTQAQVAREWRDRLYPKLEALLQTEMKASIEGRQPAGRRRYIRVLWTLVMREQAEGLADVGPYIAKFVAGSPGFVELYEAVEFDAGFWILETTRRVETQPAKRARDSRANDLVRYRCETWIPVHDPDVLRVVHWLDVEQTALKASLQQAERVYRSLDRSMRLVVRLAAIDAAIESRDYVKAAAEATAMIRRLESDFGSTANPPISVLMKLADDLTGMKLKIERRGSGLSADQKQLFDILVGLKLLSRD